MPTDKASSKTSEFLDSVLSADQGIERQTTFEEVSASFVTGGRSDAIPPQLGHRRYPCRRKSRSRIIRCGVRRVAAITAESKTEYGKRGLAHTLLTPLRSVEVIP
jgi:hypothetical protein